MSWWRATSLLLWSQHARGACTHHSEELLPGRREFRPLKANLSCKDVCHGRWRRWWTQPAGHDERMDRNEPSAALLKKSAPLCEPATPQDALRNTAASPLISGGYAQTRWKEKKKSVYHLLERGEAKSPQRWFNWGGGSTVLCWTLYLRSWDQTGWWFRLMVVMNVANSQEKAAARRCQEPLVSKIPAALQGHFITSTNNSDLRLTDKRTLKVNKMLIFYFLSCIFICWSTERHGHVA